MALTNPFGSGGGNLSGLARTIRQVTPADGSDIVAGAAAIAIICKGTAGNVAMVTAAGDEVTYPIALEEVLPVGITRIKSTGTTATGLWVFFV